MTRITGNERASGGPEPTARSVSWGPGTVGVLVCCAVAPWPGVKVFGLNLFDILLPLALLLVVFEALASDARKLPLPGWIFAPSIAAGLVYTAHVWFPALTRPPETVFRGYVEGYAALGGPAGPELILARVVLSTTLVGMLVLSEAATYGRRGTVRVVVALVVGSCASALVAVLGSLGFSALDFRTFGTITDLRATGLSFHPNSFALSLVIVLPFLVQGVFRARGLARLAACIGLVASVWSLLLADSRSGLAVGTLVLVGSIVVNAIRIRSLRPLSLSLLVLLPLLVWLVVAWLLETTRLGLTLSTDESAVGRMVLAEQGLRQWFDSPVFGVGLGLGSGVLVPVVLLASGGLVLFAGYSWMLARAIVIGWPAVRGSDLASSALLATIGLLVFGLLNNSYFERFEFIPVFVLGALGAALAAGRDAPTPALRRTLPRPR